MRLTVGSLFSGIGGLDLGLERAGMTVRWQVEIDKNAQRVLRHHWPDTALYEDVREVGGEVERVDLICGGFPCQDLSVAGRRAGLAGKRSGLFHEFMRIASELAPRWLLIENVPGLLSSNGGRDMGTVLGTLGELGYGWAYRVLDAQYFGVAQRRRRVFIVGCLGDAARAASVLLEPESCSGDSPPRREAGTRVTGGVAACLNSGGNNGGFRTEPGEHLTTVVGALACNTGPNGHDAGNLMCNQAVDAGHIMPVAATPEAHSPRYDHWTETFVTHPLTSEGHDASEDGTGRGTPIVALMQNQRGELRTSEVMSQLTCGGGKPGEGCPCVAFTASSQANSYAWESPIYPTLNAQAPNDTSNLQYGVRTGMAVRRLTPVECERLQGFPDGWTDNQSDSARYRQLGNAVCVPVAEWIGRRIMQTTTIRGTENGDTE